MGKFSRDKGARFEREIAKELEDQLGIKFKRDLDQYRASNRGDLIADCEGFPFLIETKVRAKGNFEQAWWEQAYSAALATNQRPAVVYRFDRQKTRVRIEMRAAVECCTRCRWSAESHLIDIDMDCFVHLCREGLAAASEVPKRFEWGAGDNWRSIGSIAAGMVRGKVE